LEFDPAMMRVRSAEPLFFDHKRQHSLNIKVGWKIRTTSDTDSGISMGPIYESD